MSSKVYTQTDEKVAKLDATIDMLKRMISACEEIKVGHTETSTMKKYDIDHGAFRRIVMNEKLGYHYDVKPILSIESLDSYKDTEDQLIPEMINSRLELFSWEEKFYTATIGCRDYKEIPPDLETTVPEAMKLAGLTEREEEVIRYRFQQDMTFDDIANEIGITRERCRQILAKALRKMRRPESMSVMRYGKEYCDKLLELKGINNSKQRSKRISILEDRINDAVNHHDKKALMEFRDIVNKELGIEVYGDIEILPDTLDQMKIEELELTVRGYNCLRGAGFKTVKDVKPAHYADLLKIRNMGKYTIEEIINKFDSLGIVTVFGQEYKKMQL